ncbi:hypothetical protein UFOVP1102_13 [uncultured Caudovirales phage]|jgi:hypothetical protein|uniref:Uncharacterized protein n=1 Tax=uncultured Caudovirales phage TaxID=2100421 RepID=A0A6J5QSE3_9CAUD|nr:hypothetical protein UFOVP1102_13 [uncultured Caudovirales phage]
MTNKIQNTNDLLNFLIVQSESRKDWFGFFEQKLTGIQLAHLIASNHADKMQPSEIVKYVIELNNLIYKDIIRG